jgi:translation initiation factor IF-2
MQLTTIDAPKHMEQNEINQAKEELFDKKMLIMQKLMHPVKNKKLPKNYQPDICGCMIVNGALQKQIHDVGNELLHDTFVQWQNN